MRIDWAVGCRYVEVHNNLGTLIGAGADTLTVAAVPAGVGLMAAVRICFLDHELGVHTLSTQILGPDMEPVGQPMGGQLELAGEAHKQPGWEGKIVVPVGVQWRAEDAGVYTIVFSLDDKTFDLPVIVKLPD